MNTVRLPKQYWDKKWDVTSLGEICDIQIGRTPPTKSPQYWNGPYTWVSISDMNSRVIVDSERTVTEQAVEEGKVRLVKKGTLLMSFKLTIGKLAFAGKDLFTNEAIAALVIKDEYNGNIDPEYLYWALQAIPLEEDAALAVKGKTINQTTMAAIRLPLPTLAEQRRIVARLEALLGEVREMRALVEAMRADAEQLEQSILAQAFRGEA